MTQRVFPQLRTTGWERWRRFYVDGPGFAVDWEHRFGPDSPAFGRLTRDGLSLFLSGRGAARWHTRSDGNRLRFANPVTRQA